MAKEILNEETGEMELVYTQAELDAQKAEADRILAEKDAHMQKKLDEFKQGKNSQELKEIEMQKTVEDAKRIADEAKASVDQAKQEHFNTVKNFYMEQLVGTDPEVVKQFEDAFKIVKAGKEANGFTVTGDKDIGVLVQDAMKFAGLGAGTGSNFGGGSTFVPPIPAQGGMSPNFQRNENELSDTDHQNFLKETGYDQAKDEVKS